MRMPERACLCYKRKAPRASANLHMGAMFNVPKNDQMYGFLPVL